MKHKKTIQDKIHNKVYNYKTKEKYGFNSDEVKAIISEIKEEYPNFKQDKFDDAMFGNTCMKIDDRFINYHTDVYKGIICGIEDRSLTVGEFD